jgi:hypothetical protein
VTSRAAVWRTLAAAVAGAALLSGCSVGAQADPVPLAGGRLPTAVRVPGPVGAGPGHIGAVFFLQGDRLAAQLAWLPSRDPVDQALADLVAGPAPGGAGAALRTALPGSVEQLDSTLTDGVAVVNLPTTLDRLGAHNEILAVAQIVFTATAQPGITSVRLTSGGAPMEVPTGSGRLVTRPVTRQDYPGLAP